MIEALTATLQPYRFKSQFTLPQRRSIYSKL